MMRVALVTIAILGTLCGVPESRAGQCSDSLIQSMREEGLDEDEIDAICSRADRYAANKSAVFTPEKIRRDLVGWSVGSTGIVKVNPDQGRGSRIRGTNAGSGSIGSSGTGMQGSADVYVPVPMGFVFDRTNVTDLKVLEVERSGGHATLIIQVKTVSRYAGKLRLFYERAADEWVLRQLENLSFKAY